MRLRLARSMLDWKRNRSERVDPGGDQVDELVRTFPYEKRLILNVLYDALDTLGFHIERANSDRGTFIAVTACPSFQKYRIACSNTLFGGETVLSIYPDRCGDEAEKLDGGMGRAGDETEKLDGETKKLALVLLDEVEALLKRNNRKNAVEQGFEHRIHIEKQGGLL